jgi:hypothetical protein
VCVDLSYGWIVLYSLVLLNQLFSGKKEMKLCEFPIWK